MSARLRVKLGSLSRWRKVLIDDRVLLAPTRGAWTKERALGTRSFAIFPLVWAAEIMGKTGGLIEYCRASVGWAGWCGLQSARRVPCADTGLAEHLEYSRIRIFSNIRDYPHGAC